jgi:phosphoserine aminotransferase
MNHAGK